MPHLVTAPDEGDLPSMSTEGAEEGGRIRPPPHEHETSKAGQDGDTGDEGGGDEHERDEDVPHLVAPPDEGGGDEHEREEAHDDAGLADEGSWTVLIVFSGDDERDDGLPARCRALGAVVTCIDTKVGGTSHDVRRPEVARALEARVAANEFDVVFFGTPCESFSVAHRPQLRSRRQPRGLQPTPGGWERFLAKHNELAEWTAKLAQMAYDAGAEFMIENPADRGDEASAAFWARMRDHAPLWVQPVMTALMAATGAKLITFPQCCLGASVQKYTSVLCTEEAAEKLADLHGVSCAHAWHAEKAHGRDAHGRGRAEMAAAYPRQMSQRLALAAEAVAAGAIAARRVAAGEQPRPPSALERATSAGGVDGTASGRRTPKPKGGRVVDGAQLAPIIHAKCEAARLQPPKFASLRNRVAAEPAEVACEPLPGDLYDPMEPTKPLKARKPKGGQLPPPVEWAPEGRGRGPTLDEQTSQPTGRIRIQQLYGEGVYDGVILPWLRGDATEAARALEEGQEPGKVPTIRIPASMQPAWARRHVWDCADAEDCRPVQRSTRATVFPGKRQMDRAAFRTAAAEIGHGDRDIVNQAGEGGVEVRSACEHETILAFHHQGFVASYAAAKQVLEAHTKEEWVTRPSLHLPMVPCILVPRNVIMQDRVRVGEDGKLEAYEKPRVTANSSNGGIASVNGGTDPRERYVRLPTVQDQGRAVAIVQAAAGPSPPMREVEAAALERAAAEGAALEEEASSPAGETADRDEGVGVGQAMIDLESAYSFCVVQRADWWTQCFVHWEWRVDAEGARYLHVGVSIDMRMGFGGAFAPNRFERVTRIVAAHIVRRWDEFDLTHPLPPRAERWAALRRRMQRAGLLPTAAAQAAPRHCQVYLDDFGAVALLDFVGEQAELAHIVVPEEATRLSGGVPAAAGTRLYVYVQLALVDIFGFGFAASPGKTCVGDPVGSLGFTVSGAMGRIVCPERKRDIMLADMRGQGERAELELRVSRKAVGTLVGRLVNLSQIYPELRAYLHGGYILVAAPVEAGRGDNLRLRRGRGAQVGFLRLLEEAQLLIEANEGVPLAPSLAFVERGAAGVFTSTTDASGIDGVGGYVFIAGRPGEMWLISERWPERILQALRVAASQGSERARWRAEGAEMLAMPAAELLGAWMTPAAAAAAAECTPTAVYAIGDCEPAVHALNSATGGNSQMRTAVAGARQLCSQWLGVHVLRTLNLDADRCSHPAQAAALAQEAAAAGLIVHEARIEKMPGGWQAAYDAAAAGAGGGTALGLGEPGKAPQHSRQAKRGRGDVQGRADEGRDASTAEQGTAVDEQSRAVDEQGRAPGKRPRSAQ